METPLEKLNRLESYLHRREIHPDYEYETTRGPRNAWENEHLPPDVGFVRNIYEGTNGWNRFDYHEEAYWMRPKQYIERLTMAGIPIPTDSGRPAPTGAPSTRLPPGVNAPNPPAPPSPHGAPITPEPKDWTVERAQILAMVIDRIVTHGKPAADALVAWYNAEVAKDNQA